MAHFGHTGNEEEEEVNVEEERVYWSQIRSPRRCCLRSRLLPTRMKQRPSWVTPVSTLDRGKGKSTGKQVLILNQCNTTSGCRTDLNMLLTLRTDTEEAANFRHKRTRSTGKSCQTSESIIWLFLFFFFFVIKFKIVLFFGMVVCTKFPGRGPSSYLQG